MKHQFKTNINCGGCIDKVTPTMKQHFSDDQWSVNTDHQDKILTVETDKAAHEVQQIVIDAGFKAEPVKKGLFGKLFG
ncbi:heavy metal transport/detoxification protein [Persicobacter psychrovividus]|uniref:Copper chaperone n=1 Tax=Persicobacter psychrovividus TaxID=387638 RepID=A0ABN6LCX6_9BACT|nr:hypothetical protein PEPS_15320 [Persicobacter psychrovividus]